MTTITVNVDDEVYERFRKIAAEEYNSKKGFLGDAITDGMRVIIRNKEQDAAGQRLLARARKGYKLGVWPKGFNREELYDR